jgi:hypothetical protein
MFEIDVPLSVVAGGVATSILDLSVPDGVLGDIAILVAHKWFRWWQSRT